MICLIGSIYLSNTNAKPRFRFGDFVVRVDDTYDSCTYTTGKKCGIFFITAIFCIFVEYEGCFCTWNTFLRADITFGGVNFHLTAKWSAKVQKQLFWYFFQLNYGKNTCCSFARLLSYPFVCCIEILLTIPVFIYPLIWYGQQEISVVGASHRRTWVVILVYHKVMYTRYWSITNNRSFHTELNKQSVKNLSLSKSDWISIWCAQPAASSLKSW